MITLVATCTGLFLVQLDTTAVNLALPSVARGLHGGLTSLQWVLDAYNVAFAALLLSGGTLGDRYGRRRLFLAGIIGFLAGSLLCALAPTLGLLIVGRVAQGIGAAMAIPQSLALLAVAFPGQAERNRAMAAWATVAGVALAAGPTLGGALVSSAGWQSIFYLNVPVGLTALAMARRGVAESADPDAAGLDAGGQLLGAGLLATVTFTVVDGNSRGWTSAPILMSGGVAAVCLIGFLLVEAKAERPMLPLGLLRRGQLPVASVIAACMTFGMYGLLLLVSLDLQFERGASVLTAGLELLPLPAVFAVGSPFVGRLVTRCGPRMPMTAGLTLMGGGLLAYASLGRGAPVAVLGVVLAAIGLGLALNGGPVVGVAVSAVPAPRAGLASGVVNVARMAGATLGVAVLGAVEASYSHGSTHGAGFLEGLTVALIVGGIIELAGALLAVVAIANPARENSRNPTALAGQGTRAPTCTASQADAGMR